MKIYTDAVEALNVVENSNTTFIAKLCPFHVRMSTRTLLSTRTLCGSWCPHFFVSTKKDNEIYITCSGQEVCVGIID